MILRDYICEHCGEIRIDELVDSVEEIVRCGNCEAVMEWLPTPIEIRTSDSRTFLDGTKRPGFAELKEQLALEEAAQDMHPSKRAAIEKEILKVGSHGKD